MSFLQHLEVLRWHLIRSAIAIGIGTIGAFINGRWLADNVVLAHKNSDFITYRVICRLVAKMSEWVPSLFSVDTSCIGQNLPDKIQNFSMPGQFMAHILMSLVIGLVIAFPYIVWEVWRFINPALKKPERRMARGFVFFTSLLFISGILFAYFLLAPLSVNFFLTYEISDQIENIPTFSSYVSLVTTLVISCGMVFQLPMLIFFLSKMGIVSPLLLRKYRRHALVGTLALAAIITPPDPLSQLLVTVPLWILYEISILISAAVRRKQEF